MLPVHGHLCSVCGERVLSPVVPAPSGGPLLCPFCQRVEQDFARAVAYGSYQGGLRELIHLLKYDGVRPAAGVLGRMLAEAISARKLFGGEDSAASPVLVIPVPLRHAKRRQRDFNHAELIARAAIKLLAHDLIREDLLREDLLTEDLLTGDGSFCRKEMILSQNILQRKRETQSQTGLTIRQRQENVRGAFAVTRAQEVNGREVLLVDDVYTTGATVSECTRVLRRAGATKVWVATVARTLKLASKYGERRPAAGVSSGEMEEPPLATAVS